MQKICKSVLMGFFFAVSVFVLSVSFIDSGNNQEIHISSVEIEDEAEPLKQIESQEISQGIKSVQYALIDCGNDSKKQLALRTCGMAFHYPNDDSDFTMVFDWQGGNVVLIYAVAFWARSCDTLYANGYVSGWGSGGTYSYRGNYRHRKAFGIMDDMGDEKNKIMWWEINWD